MVLDETMMNPTTNASIDQHDTFMKHMKANAQDHVNNMYMHDRTGGSTGLRRYVMFYVCASKMRDAL